MKGLTDLFKKLYGMKFYILAFIAAFLFFVAYFFPDEQVLRLVFSTVSKQTGMTITPTDPKMVFFPDLGIQFASASITGKDGRSSIKLGDTSIAMPLTSIITFSPAMEIGSRSFRGEINANILGLPINPAKSVDELYLDVDSKGIKLSELIKDQPIDIDAIVDLAVQGNMNMINPAYSDLDISSSLSKIQIQEGSLMGFPIPNVFIKNGEVAMALSKGELIIAKLNLGAPNDELNLSVKGKVSLKTNNPYDLSIKLKVTGNLEQQFGGFLGMLPAQAKNSEGFYNIRVRGDKRSPIPQIIPIQ